ncbi:MAG: VOC family protein [Alphaproteobacteria bacterium]
MEQRLSLVTLGVADIARSRHFYERLGWTASKLGGDEVAFFQLGGIILSLWSRASLAADMGVVDETRGFGGVAIAHNVRAKDDVDALLKEAEGAGARVLKSGMATDWGGYIGYFADPDGHTWEVAWNPAFPIASDGSVKLPR